WPSSLPCYHMAIAAARAASHRAPLAQLDQSVWLRTRRPGVRVSQGAPLSLRAQARPVHLAATSGVRAKCSLTNQASSSLVRRTWLTTRSFVPASPTSSAVRASSRHAAMMIWWASSSRESCSGTSSLPRGTRNRGSFRDVGCHGEADAAEKLNALGNGVRQLHLFGEVLVEKQMELIKRRAGDLPVAFLVQI